MSTTPISASLPSTPEEWWGEVFEQHQGRHDELHGVTADGTWAQLADLAAPGQVASLHRRFQTQHGLPANAAAKWVLGATVGPAAAAVGFVLALTGAGVLTGTAPVRLRRNTEEWPERVDLRGSWVLVTQGHPWVGVTGVEVVDEEALLRRTRDALVDAARPFVDALRPLGRVGANAMWAEVADEVGLATTHAPALDVTEEMVTRVIRFLELPGAPWRRRPDLRSADVTDTRACLARKAGCCLAYLAAGDHVEVDDPELSARQRDWYQRFPPAAEVRQTCTTCSLRELSDCEDRQRFWFELDRDHRI